VPNNIVLRVLFSVHICLKFYDLGRHLRIDNVEPLGSRILNWIFDYRGNDRLFNIDLCDSYDIKKVFNLLK